MAVKTTSNISIKQFKNICFVGLNKVEFHPAEGEVVFAENWMDVIDEQARKKLILAFFAPRDLSGAPTDPVEALAGDAAENSPDFLQQLKNIALFDMCRGQRAEPNTVNVLIVADVLYHWDANDNYVQPTTPETWAQDLQLIFKHYPRTTTRKVYTNWDITPAQDIENVSFFSIADLPLDGQMWINRPSFQEKYGTYFLIAGIIAAILSYGANHFKSKELAQVQMQTRIAEREGAAARNTRAMAEQITSIDDQLRYRTIFALIFKDIGIAIDNGDLRARDFTLENPRPQVAPQNLLASVRLEPDVYSTLQQQEQAARKLVQNSATIMAVRKPPSGGSQFVAFEGLIPLERVALEVREFRTLLDSTNPTSTSPQANQEESAQ